MYIVIEIHKNEPFLAGYGSTLEEAQTNAAQSQDFTSYVEYTEAVVVNKSVVHTIKI